MISDHVIISVSPEFRRAYVAEFGITDEIGARHEPQVAQAIADSLEKGASGTE